MASTITLAENASAPGTPVASQAVIYFKTDGKPYSKDDAGNEYPLAGTGATGGGTNAVFVECDTNVTVDYTITSGKNAGTFGPVTIDSGITVTIPSGSVWSIV